MAGIGSRFFSTVSTTVREREINAWGKKYPFYDLEKAFKIQKGKLGSRFFACVCVVWKKRARYLQKVETFVEENYLNVRDIYFTN